MTPHTTNIRIRLSDRDIRDLETIRAFLGLPSVSQTAARLAVWNASALASSLRSEPQDDFGPVAVAIAHAANQATKEALRGMIVSRG